MSTAKSILITLALCIVGAIALGAVATYNPNPPPPPPQHVIVCTTGPSGQEVCP